jgi:glycosyltransferase involved in cell wall biosynthesis
MKVLMMTPTVDPLDPSHGFIYTLVEQIARRVDKLYVITLVHTGGKPDGVPEIYSLDTRKNRLSKLLYLNRILLKLMPKVDVVFTHMYPIFPILVWPCARLFGKPVVMWRTHCHMNLRSRLSHTLVNRVVTAVPESFRIKSNKVKVIGHSVELDKFAFRAEPNLEDGPVILSVGRISPVKNYEVMIEALHILVKKYGLKSSKLTLVGGPASESKDPYFEKVRALAQERGVEPHCVFTGPVPFNRVAEFYQNAELFINATPTGSFDRVVLEAIASGNLPLVCNKAFLPFFGEYGDVLFFRENDSQDLAKKTADLYSMKQEEKDKIRFFLRKMVEAEHSFDARLSKLVAVFKGVSGKN